MRILKSNLMLGLRVLICAFVFLLTIVVGALRDADPLRLFLSSVFVYIFFFVLSGVFVRILDRIHDESTLRPRSSEEVPVDDSKRGQFFDTMQNAEMPFEP